MTNTVNSWLLLHLSIWGLHLWYKVADQFPAMRSVVQVIKRICIVYFFPSKDIFLNVWHWILLLNIICNSLITKSHLAQRETRKYNLHLWWLHAMINLGILLLQEERGVTRRKGSHRTWWECLIQLCTSHFDKGLLSYMLVHNHLLVKHYWSFRSCFAFFCTYEVSWMSTIELFLKFIFTGITLTMTSCLYFKWDTEYFLWFIYIARHCIKYVNIFLNGIKHIMLPHNINPS